MNTFFFAVDMFAEETSDKTFDDLEECPESVIKNFLDDEDSDELLE